MLFTYLYKINLASKNSALYYYHSLIYIVHIFVFVLSNLKFVPVAAKNVKGNNTNKEYKTTKEDKSKEAHKIPRGP